MSPTPLLSELGAVLESCGGFEKVEEFGPAVDEGSCWNYDAGMLFMDFRCLRRVWSEAQGSDHDMASAATLLLSGDNYTAWNKRKRRPVSREELALNAVVLQRHPKAGSAWSHRRWLLSKLGLNFDAEFRLCATLAERYPRNYFAWTHRSWVADRFDETKDFDFVTSWLRSHVTDYSAAHYAVRLAARFNLLTDLDQLHTDLCTAYPHLALHPNGALAYLHRSIHHAAALISTITTSLRDPLHPLRHPRCVRWFETNVLPQDEKTIS